MIKLSYSVYFFNFKPWFSASFKTLIWTTYFFWFSILQISFSTFFNFFFSPVKIVNTYENWIKFSDTPHLLQENISYHYFHHSFFIKVFVKFIDKFLTHSNPFTGSFWHIAHPHKLFASKYSIYEESIF